MATLQNTTIASNLNLYEATCVVTPGYIWYDCVSNTLKYSYQTLSSTFTSKANSINCVRLPASSGDSGDLLMTGQWPSAIGCTERFDLSANTWSACSTPTIARMQAAMAGTSNTSVLFGGAAYLTCTEEFSSNTWSTGGAMTIGKECFGVGVGTQNAALATGAESPAPLFEAGCTEEYNGSTWSTGGAMILGRAGGSGGGSQNAALMVGGVCTPNANNTCTEEYNGTTWSAAADFLFPPTVNWNTTSFGATFGGTQNNGTLVTAIVEDCTSKYNGVTWSDLGASLINSRGTARCAGDLSGISGFTVAGCLYTEAYDESIVCCIYEFT